MNVKKRKEKKSVICKYAKLLAVLKGLGTVSQEVWVWQIIQGEYMKNEDVL